MIANADRVREWCDECEVETLFADGLDDAVIGITRDLRSGEYRVVYDTHRVVQILVNDQGMDYDDAVEHLEHNIVAAYVGERTPVWSFLPAIDEEGEE
jgi:hypothetical protein